MGVLLGFLRIPDSPLARKVLAGVAIAIVVAGAWFAFSRHYISIGKQKGETRERAAADVATEQTHAADRGQTGQQLAGLQAQADAAQKRADAANDRAARLEGHVAALGQQLASAQHSVSQIPVAGLHSYNVEKLASRDPADATPGYTPAEERRIAELATTAPLVSEQLAQSTAAINEVKGEVQELRKKVDLQDAKFAALAGYTNRLEGYYAEVWNRTPKKRKAWKCLKVWNCGKLTLGVPDPAELTGKRPQ